MALTLTHTLRNTCIDLYNSSKAEIFFCVAYPLENKNDIELVPWV